MPRPFYCFAALILGLFWYAALAISFLPRFSHSRFPIPAPEDVFDPKVLLICAVSVTLAVVFRRFIVRADTVPKSLAVALVLPLVGTMLTIAGVMTSLALLRGNSVVDILNGILMTPIAAVFYGLPVITTSYWVIVPMGLVSQLVMARIGREQTTPVDKPLLLITAASVTLAIIFGSYVVPFR